MIRAGDLDRRLQFVRAASSRDGFGHVQTWANHGLPVWGSRKDARDGEKVAAGQVMAALVSRFVVRSSEFTRGITPKDRFTCDGRTWEVQGVKEIGRQEAVEITAVAEAD